MGGGAAEGRPPHCLEAAGGRLPYEWVLVCEAPAAYLTEVTKVDENCLNCISLQTGLIGAYNGPISLLLCWSLSMCLYLLPSQLPALKTQDSSAARTVRLQLLMAKNLRN